MFQNDFKKMKTLSHVIVLVRFIYTHTHTRFFFLIRTAR